MAHGIYYTPRGEAGSVSVLFSTAQGGYTTRFKGNIEQNAATAVTVGGKTFSVTTDSWFEYEFKCEGIKWDFSTDFLARLLGFISHARAGGEFIFRYDTAKTASTTTSAGNTQGDTALTVSSISGLADDDIIYIEDANDPTKFMVNRIAATPAGSTVTVGTGLVYGFSSGSIVRDWQNFPACVATEVDFVERDAGRGVDLWDLTLKFRTVR